MPSVILTVRRKLYQFSDFDAVGHSYGQSTTLHQFFDSDAVGHSYDESTTLGQLSYSDAVGHSYGRSTILHQFSDFDAVGDSFSQQLVPVVLRHFRELSRINTKSYRFYSLVDRILDLLLSRLGSKIF